MIKTFLILSFILLSPVSFASDKLFTATYKGRHSGIGIKLVRSLVQNSDNTFTLSSKATSFIGSITEVSKFEQGRGRLIPHQYDFTRKVLGSKSLQSLSFDWESMQAHFRRKDKPDKNKDYELILGALDPSLYQLKLQQELYSGKNIFSFDFAKGGRMKKLEFQLLDTPSNYKLGKKTYKALELERINQPDQKRTNILVIPGLNYQIAKIVHTEKDGSTYKVELTDFECNTDKLLEFYNSIAPRI